MELFFFLIISLAFILLSCLVFTNSIEWLGSRLNLSHGITGSVLAAVGTALPETVVPLVAIFWGINSHTLGLLLHGKVDALSTTNQISIGAIVGAPFMLSTVAFFLIGFSSFIYLKSGRRDSSEIKVDKTFLERDLSFFIVSFLFAFLAVFIHNKLFHVLLALFLVGYYVFYLYETFTKEKDIEKKVSGFEETLSPLYLCKILPFLKLSLFSISIQLVLSLGCLIYSAHLFVEVVKDISHHLNFSPFVLSLLLAPLATELPEKFNSWIWIRQKKDILAIGNISGAMVFQSTFPVTAGLLFTSWLVDSFVLYLAFIFSLINALLILFALKTSKLTYNWFLLCGVLYVVYLVMVFANI